MGAVGEDLVGIAALAPTREGTERAPCSGLKGKAIGDARPFKTGYFTCAWWQVFSQDPREQSSANFGFGDTPGRRATLTSGHRWARGVWEGICDFCVSEGDTRFNRPQNALQAGPLTRREGYSGRPRGRGK